MVMITVSPHYNAHRIARDYTRKVFNISNVITFNIFYIFHAELVSIDKVFIQGGPKVFLLTARRRY